MSEDGKALTKKHTAAASPNEASGAKLDTYYAIKIAHWGLGKMGLRDEDSSAHTIAAYLTMTDTLAALRDNPATIRLMNRKLPGVPKDLESLADGVEKNWEYLVKTIQADGGILWGGQPLVDEFIALGKDQVVSGFRTLAQMVREKLKTKLQIGDLANIAAPAPKLLE